MQVKEELRKILYAPYCVENFAYSLQSGGKCVFLNMY